MAYLEKIVPTQNMYRFYSIEVCPTLFGSWALIRRWGRIGAKGQKLERWFEVEDDAQNAGAQITEQKRRRGYQHRIV